MRLTGRRWFDLRQAFLSISDIPLNFPLQSPLPPYPLHDPRPSLQKTRFARALSSGHACWKPGYLRPRPAAASTLPTYSQRTPVSLRLQRIPRRGDRPKRCCKVLRWRVLRMMLCPRQRTWKDWRCSLRRGRATQQSNATLPLPLRRARRRSLRTHRSAGVQPRPLGW